MAASKGLTLLERLRLPKEERRALEAEEDAEKIRLYVEKGDFDAFDRLMNRYRYRMTVVAFRMLRKYKAFPDKEGLAAEAYSEAILRAERGMFGFEFRSRFVTWLYSIVVNATIDIIRREKRALKAKYTEVDEGPRVLTVEEEEELARRSEQAALREQYSKVLGKLSLPHREVLFMREFQEMSYKDMARALRIPIGTVMSRLSFARANAREHLRTMLVAEYVPKPKAEVRVTAAGKRVMTRAKK